MCAYDTTLSDVMRPPLGTSLLPAPSRRRSARLEVLLPGSRRSAVTLCLALCGIFLATSFFRLNETDLWAHLAFGRWMVEHRGLPAADPMRVADGSQHFVNVPWLSQLSGYLWYRVAGPGGLQLAHAVLVTLGFGLLIAAIRLRGASLIQAALAGVVGYVLALPTVGTIRPQLFGFLGMSLVLLALTLSKRHRSVLVWLPAVFALWANLHGSVVVGLLVLVCASVGHFWDVWRRTGSVVAAWRAPQSRRLRLLVLLCTGATLLNPSGPALWWNILLFEHNTILADITEWAPTTLRSVTGMLLFGSLLATGVLLRRSPRPVRGHEVLLIVIFAAATLSAMRMLCWWALVWPYVAAPHAAAARRLSRARRTAPGRANAAADEPRAMLTFIATAAVFLTLVWAPTTHELITGRPRSEAVVVSYDTPVFVGEELREKHLAGRVFAPMEWADYLLWTTHGAVRPLVYSHVHLLDQATWNDYRLLATGSRDVVEIVDRRKLDYLVLPRSTATALAEPLAKSGRFRILYQDQQAVLMQVLPPMADRPDGSKRAKAA